MTHSFGKQNQSTSFTFAALHALVFFAWTAQTLWLLVHHELWRDEADAWLIARDATWTEMFHILPDAGQPPLWYLTLKVAVAAGFDWRAMQAINIVAVWLSGWLLLFRSTLGLAVTIPVLFSFVFSFEYPVVARNYGLGILGLFLFVSLHSDGTKQKTGRASSFAANMLMCGSSIHFMTLALVLWLSRGFGSWRKFEIKRKAFSIWQEWPFLVPFIACVLILWPTGTGQFSGSFLPNFRTQSLFESLIHYILPFETPSWRVFSVAAGLTVMMIAGFPGRYAILLFLAGLFILEAIFVAVYYQGGVRHSGLIMVWLAASAWHGKTMTKINNSARPRAILRRSNLLPLGLWLATSWNLPLQFEVYRLERNQDFSEALRAAAFVNQERYMQRQLTCWLPRSCSAVSIYLTNHQRKFWYPVLERSGTFDHWDAKSEALNRYLAMREHPFADILASTIRRSADWGQPGGPLFLSTKRIPEPESVKLKLISIPAKKAWRILDESFWIYAPIEDSP